MAAFAFDVGVAGQDLFVGDIMLYFLLLYVGLPLVVVLSIWAVTVVALKLFDWVTSPRTPRPAKTQQPTPPPEPPKYSLLDDLPRYPI